MSKLMDQGSAHSIRVERESASVAAIIVGNGILQDQLSKFLAKQGIRSTACHSVGEIPGLVEAKYVFLFLDQEKMVTEGDVFILKLASFAKKFSAKLICVFDQLPSEQQRHVEQVLAEAGSVATGVELRSGVQSPEAANEVSGKITRLAFSNRVGDKLIIGEFGGIDQEAGRIVSLKPTKVQGGRRKLNLRKMVWPGLVIGLLVIPFLAGLLYGGLAVSELWSAKQALAAENFDLAQEKASLAAEKFETIATMCSNVSVGGKLDEVCNSFSNAQLVGDTLVKGADVQKKVKAVATAFFAVDGESPDLVTFAKELTSESQDIEENLGFLEASFTKDYGFMKKLAGFFGINEQKLNDYLGFIPKIRDLARVGRDVGPVTADVLGVSDFFSQAEPKKTYLVIFQNSFELRATGGFVGSYAIVRVEKGRMLDAKVNDIYTSDGQLKGRIVPPDEIFQYLGQPAWFMRDANFSPDFPLSAKRLAWFLEKETGQNVDGVIAVSLPALVKMLAAVGPVNIQGSSEPITAENFAKKAEFAAELSFTGEVNQKRDFLGEVSEAILTKMSSHDKLDYGKMVQAMASALSQKDLMFYFDSGPAQKVMEENGLAGSLASSKCSSGQNCVMVVEDNFGANKANYFVKKNMAVHATIDKAGGVTTDVVLKFDNTSPNDSWPGGRYKNYLRVLVPKAAELRNFEIGDGRSASVSAVLSAEVLASVPDKKFLVYQTDEQFLTTREASVSGFKSLGVLVEIPAGEKREISMQYHLRNMLDFQKDSDRFGLTILKQPGSVFDPLSVQIGFPVFLTPIREAKFGLPAPIVKPQELDYNSVLDQDLSFEVKFKRD